jgi:hypothetical protein
MRPTSAEARLLVFGLALALTACGSSASAPHDGAAGDTHEGGAGVGAAGNAGASGNAGAGGSGNAGAGGKTGTGGIGGAGGKAGTGGNGGAGGKAGAGGSGNAGAGGKTGGTCGTMTCDPGGQCCFACISLCAAAGESCPVFIQDPCSTQKDAGASPGGACSDKSPTCSGGQVCDLNQPGRCTASTATGTCIDKPAVCPLDYLPVCGCDHVTYSNDCERQAAGAQLDHTGAC